MRVEAVKLSLDPRFTAISMIWFCKAVFKQCLRDDEAGVKSFLQRIWSLFSGTRSQIDRFQKDGNAGRIPGHVQNVQVLTVFKGV